MGPGGNTPTLSFSLTLIESTNDYGTFSEAGYTLLDMKHFH
jgi:hypothetical protein